MKTFLLSWAPAFVAALMLGCAPVAAQDQRTLTIGMASDISGFDVHQTRATLTASVLINIFDYLVVKDENGEIQPSLAVSWENIDPLTWRLKLREGVKFHNGDDFTAADVKFTLERVATDTQFVENRNYRQIKEVRIVDDHTVDIVTHSPDPVLINRISRIASNMLPKAYLESVGIEEFMRHPIGTGPYKFESWSRDSEIVLTGNADYFGGAPTWDQVRYRIIPEASTRTAELLTGGIDIALNILPTDQVRINEGADTSIAVGQTKRVLALQVPMAIEPFGDTRVREAIDLAINEKLIADTIYEGNALPTRTLTVAGTPGLEESLYDTFVYDPDQARALLADAGFANGLTIDLTTANGQYLKDREMTQLIAAMLGEVGITAKLEVMETSRFAERRTAKTFTGLWLNGFSNSLNDPATDYVSLISANSAGITDYVNPEFDAIYAEAEVNMDPASRQEQFKTLQRMMAEDRPLIPLLQLSAIYGVRDTVNFTPRVDEMIILNDVLPASGN